MKETRINKYLSEAGYCSRRAADKLIEQNRVTINGKVPEMGTKVQPGDVVAVDGKNVNNKNRENIYIALNKPVGIVCTTDTRVEPDNIIDFMNYPERIFPIGLHYSNISLYLPHVAHHQRDFGNLTLVTLKGIQKRPLHL